jgi:hypothetical protein
MIRRVILVMVAATLVASSCSAGGDDAVSEAAPGDTEIEAELIDDAEINTELGDPDQQVADLDDAELARFLAELSDDELDDLLLKVDDDSYDRVLDVLDAIEPDGGPDGGGSDEAQADEPPVSAADSAAAGPDELDEDAQAILDELLANGFCDPADVEDGGVVTAMHFVVKGQVQPPCSGEVDPRLDAAWTAMADVTPAALLSDISLLAGFEGCDTCDTLAFVTTLDEDAEFFLMAIDVQAGAEDPNELALTMQHELTHVFTQVPATQLDISIPAEECTTYYNGTGCLRESAYTWQWIQQFWDAEALATIPADGDVNEEAGEARCVTDAPYTGSYGASNPEEDIAEVFAAYVFDVDVSTALEEKLAFFDQYPEFREVRERAEALGRWDADYSFEDC